MFRGCRLLSAPAGQDFPDYINNHVEMEPLLLKALDNTSWIIIMYHAIGIPEGWGYYPLEEFILDINTLAEHDFWGGNMDMVACYIQERNNFSIDTDEIEAGGNFVTYKIVFNDGLDNTIYNQPLTLDFTFSAELQIKRVHIEPAINSETDFEVINNKLRLHVIPDEKIHYITIYSI